MKSTLIEKLTIATPIAIIIAACVFGPQCCTRPESAKLLLEQQGFKDVEITGWRPLMAGKDDAISTGFKATSPNGSKVSGAVTVGMFFKGATVRFD